MHTITYQYSTTQDLHLQLYARVNKTFFVSYVALFVTLYSLTYLQERHSVHVQHLLRESVEILHMHVVNVSLVNRLESKGRQIVITSECGNYLLNKNLK